MSEKKIKIIFFGIIALFALVSRFLPHPPNLVPIGALSIMAGAFLPKKYALVLPLGIMLIADYFIGFYQITVMLSVYLGFLAYVLLGSFFGKSHKTKKLVLSSFLGALFFFLVTNFAVWAFTPYYPKTLTGLITSYTLALPFFKNTLIGDLFYVFVFSSAYKFVLNKGPTLSSILKKLQITNYNKQIKNEVSK